VRSAFHSLNWPGNVRELKNAIESAFSYVQSPLITLKDIPDYLLEETDNDAWAFDESEEFIPSVNVDMHLPLREAMESFEREYIFFHAEKAQSLVDLARRLSISKQLLHHKIKKYNLTFHFTK
jgi:arginine utilization regulatory protein